jgi:hypothetical protein
MWPIPALNILKNFHFADDTLNWHRRGKSVNGDLINWSVRNSSLDRDVKYRQLGGEGIRYLAINCGGECTEDQAVYQDVAVAGQIGAGQYTYAARIISESGAGTIRVGLRQIDSNGNELAKAETTARIDDKNERFSRADSIVLAGNFVSGTVQLDRRAKVLRFELSPTTSNTFNVVDTWLIRN